MPRSLTDEILEEASSDNVWRPRLLDPADEADARRLTAIRDSGVVRRVHDTLEAQAGQLARTRNPHLAADDPRLTGCVEEILGGRQMADYGTWVWYPWSARLVRVLPRSEFRELRTDRNRYKITAAEQLALGHRRIGVIGLSVGSASAITLAQEGVGGSFKIADFDQVELSNLNRLRAGVHELGIQKTVVTARHMVEIDPYLDITTYPDGIRPDTVDDFLLGDGPLDLVVEECDDLYVKVAIREGARAHGIPVVMETNDRGMLDVERFDLDPERPIFHGLLGEVRAEELQGLATKDKVPFVLAILDERRLGTRMAASLPEIQQTLSSWPQLASGAAVGGAVTTEAARRILLGEAMPSGRIYVDPFDDARAEEILYREPVAAPAPPGPVPEARTAPVLPAEPGRSERITPDAARWIAAMGTLAPSPHNNQPWQLTWQEAGQQLECRHDGSRDLPTLDFENGATWAAFGALSENVRMAAARLGFRSRVLTWPDPGRQDLVCVVKLTPDPRVGEPELFPAITRRVTNRRREEPRPLAGDVVSCLTEAAAELGAHLRLVTTDVDLRTMADLIGAADRIGLLNPAIHAETMHGLRWTPEEVRAKPHGVDVTTMELTASERAGLRLLTQRRVIDFLAEIGGGRGLEELARKQVATASAIGLLTVPGLSRDSYFLGGRAMQRVWLSATARGVALHPMTNLPYMFARLERGGGAGLSRAERDELTALRGRYTRLFPTPPGHAEVLLFKLAHAGPPTARALRRPLDEVLTLAPPPRQASALPGSSPPS
ncbi:Rv1355c family protein [Herbidospora sp. NEAU-GS84]|uniref:Rv1355c family protein n=1 Tax=Herbidospora solisilvae TaxID=2696284 RepID=A0A7C9JBL8_9ACTN|nr:Rv1355c family protein [Herbidospora solisilvae]NAS25948.1 Rv1355c family protein [Herbidospora solisilvae]